uniref:Uncharacterized protein n=1 Tax=Rhizophora mucronata TaxID=61149 RepID=A0A2P2QWB7_RHIMU
MISQPREKNISPQTKHRKRNGKRISEAKSTSLCNSVSLFLAFWLSRVVVF